jgi:hypothetical protein
MQLGKTGATLTADRAEYGLLDTNKAPMPLAVLLDEQLEDDVITGAEYDIEEMNLVANAAHRAKDQSMTALYPQAADLQADDTQTRTAAMEQQRRAVLDDDGTRSKLMRTAIVASKILSDLEQLRR